MQWMSFLFIPSFAYSNMAQYTYLESSRVWKLCNAALDRISRMEI